MIREAAGRGAQLVVTQELFATDYFPQVEDESHFDLAEPIPGPTSERLGKLAAELGVTIVASLFEKRAPGLYHNTAITLTPESSARPVGAIADRYRKMHIPDDPGFFEKYYFTPGDLGWRTCRTPHAEIGTLICWDQWYPEAARLTVLRGAELLVYPTAIGWLTSDTPELHLQQREAWITMQRAHAIANGVFVIAVNRIGVEGAITFYGSSFVADPGGQVIAQASTDAEESLVVDCDLSLIETQRRGWPFLRDRRIDAYGDLQRRYVD